MTKKKSPTPEERKELVGKLNKSLYDMAFGDIKRAMDGGSKMGAFILASCFIDAMAGYIKGGATCRSDYESFIVRFMKSYNPENLYKDLRCKLVHNYSEGGSYWFVDNQEKWHLKTNYDSKIFINLENFMKDIEKAYIDLIELVNTNDEVFIKAKKRLDSIGTLDTKENILTNYEISTLTDSGSGSDKI